MGVVQDFRLPTRGTSLCAMNAFGKSQIGQTPDTTAKAFPNKQADADCVGAITLLFIHTGSLRTLMEQLHSIGPTAGTVALNLWLRQKTSPVHPVSRLSCASVTH